MPLLAATNIRKNYGVDVILEGVSLSLEAGERIGLVGRNGQGKSTLMKILAGLMPPDSGDVGLARGRRAGYLHQDPMLNPDESVRDAAEGAFDELHRLHEEQHRLFDEMAAADHSTPAGAAETDRLMKRHADLERRIEALGGYAIDHTIDAALHGVGLTDAEFPLKVRSLSGGQKGRLALARLLLEAPDLLLLDEPTNHLDIAGRLWLEGFLLREFRGAVLLVTHDRRLLQNVVTRIVEVEQGRLIDYPGSYSAFREIRGQRRLTQMRAYEKQQDKFRAEEAYIRKYKAGQRAKQAKGRESRLDREKEQNTLERPMELAALRLQLPPAPRSGDVVVAARGLSKSYPNQDGSTRVLFDAFDVVIGRGERWGIIGPNGAGKTTLVRAMLGELKPDAGSVKIGSNVIPGYYRQTHEGVDMALQVFRYLQKMVLKENPGKEWSEQQARDLAGAFLFSGDEQEKELGVLSGGERSRAVLAGLLASAKNLLILDEPTNHLDISSAERLEDALGRPASVKEEAAAAGEEVEDDADGAFEGTLILISHDRALIDATCDRLIVLDGAGGAEIFLGNYSRWLARDQERSREKRDADARAADAQERAVKQKRAAEETRKKSAPSAPSGGASGAGGKQRGMRSSLERLTVEQIEQKIEAAQARIRQIDESLADPSVWRDAKKSNKLGDERAALLAELEPLEFEWASRAEEA